MTDMNSSNSFNGPLCIIRGSASLKLWELRAIIVAIGLPGCVLVAYCLYVLVFRPGDDQARYLYNVLSVAGLILGLLITGFALLCLLDLRNEKKVVRDPRNSLLGYGIYGKSLVRGQIPLEAREWTEFRRTHCLSSDSTAWAHLTSSEIPGVVSTVEVIVIPDNVNPEEFRIAGIVFTLDSEQQRSVNFGGAISEVLCAGNLYAQFCEGR